MSVQSIGQCVVRIKQHLDTIGLENGLSYIKTGFLDKTEIRSALRKISEEVFSCLIELESTDSNYEPLPEFPENY